MAPGVVGGIGLFRQLQFLLYGICYHLCVNHDSHLLDGCCCYSSKEVKSSSAIAQEREDAKKGWEQYIAEKNRERDKQERILKEVSLYPDESETGIGKYLFVDTETIGIPKDYDGDVYDVDNWPRVVQLAWMLIDEDGKLVSDDCSIVKNKGVVPKRAEEVHGISTKRMRAEGVPPKDAYKHLMDAIACAEYVIIHNVDFDKPVIAADMLRHKMNDLAEKFLSQSFFCTMKSGVDICRLPGYHGEYKYPKLVELFGKLYLDDSSVSIGGLHSADADVLVTYRCFMKMKEKGYAKI